MTTGFVRYPSLPHLDARHAQTRRADKLLDPLVRDELLAGSLIVEEKLDGDNLGLSVVDGELRVQHRGDYVRLDEGWRYPRLASWIAIHGDGLREGLQEDLILFGEWCALVHSVRYDRLPDWFVAFDLFEIRAQRFFSARRRDAWCADLGISVVPRLAHGHHTLGELESLLANSRFGSEPMEGLVIRSDVGRELRARAKLVGSAFVQTDDEHWRRRPLEANHLALNAQGRSLSA